MARVSSKKTLKLVTETGSELSDELRAGFNVAKDHKSATGVSDNLVHNVEQVNSQYDPKLQIQIEAANEPCVFFPLGALKSRAQFSWVRDVVAGAMGKMWQGEPTAISELPPDSRSAIQQEILADMAEIDDLAVVDFGVVQEFVDTAVDEEMDRLFEEAQEKADRMSRLILDQWQEGGWIDAWSEAINDLGTYPISIIKGPVEVSKLKGKWSSTGKWTETTEVEPIMYRVAPENWYPMPDVGHDVNSGSGVYELATLTKSELHWAKKNKNYDMDAIDRVMMEHEDGFTEADSDWMKVAKILKRSEDATENDLGYGNYNCIKYYGLMKMGLLREHVKTLAKTLEDDEYHEVEVWMIDDEVIYAVLSPYPLQHRPFSVVPRQFVAGSAWGGESLQDMIETPQRIVNALVRQHILNMGFAAQPIGEVESSRIAGGKPPKQVRAGTIYPVLSSVHGEKAYRFQEFDSKSTEYINAMDYYLVKADDLSGIPGYIIGSPGAESQATLGQTNFYYSNASKGIGSLLSLIDRFLIEPMLDRYYIRNMIEVDDDSIKGDVAWNAKGLAGIFEQQVKQDQSAQVVQMLTQLREVMPSYITEESFVEVVEPLFRSIGLDIDDVLKQNPQIASGAQPPQQGGLPPPPAPVSPEQITQDLNTASTPTQSISTET